jgi:thiol:disulfide interchange protein DsbD
MNKFKHLFALVVAIMTVSLSAAAALPKHVTWKTSVDKISDTEGVIKWQADIENGWHIYNTEMPSLPDTPMPEPTTFEVEPVQGLELVGKPEPSVAANNHYDEVLKLNLSWWENAVTFSQKFKLNGITGVEIKGTIGYMACTANACTPPTHEDFSIKFGDPSAIAPAQDEPAKVEVAQTAPATTGDSSWWTPVEANNPEQTISTANTSIWGIFGLGLIGGLVALLTPCVWPMIPMTVSFFLKKGKSRRRSIIDAVTYGVSIVVIYLVLGIAITVIFGAGKLNDLATSALFNIIFFAILVIFAISFFGAFDIKLPSKWSNAIDSKAENTTGLISIFFMAFTLVLVSFSCTGPIIGTLLVEAASQGNIVGPAIGMGGFALGLAMPFALFAFFPTMLKEMPRSGGWLNSVKVVLGFIELILSLKFLSVADLAYGWRLLDREIFIAIWIVLFALMGVYLLGKLRFSHDSATESISVPRFFLAVCSFSFAVYLVPGLWGAPLKGISAFAPPLTTQDFNLYGGEFKEFDNYDEGMAYAKEHNKPVIVDFSGFACVNCRKMEGAVFDTPEVRSIVERDYVLIKLMVDDKKKLDAPYEVEEYGSTTKIRTVGERWSYLQRHKFGTSTQPYYVLLDNEGQPLMSSRSYDENLPEFVNWLNSGKDNYSK